MQTAELEFRRGNRNSIKVGTASCVRPDIAEHLLEQERGKMALMEFLTAHGEADIQSEFVWFVARG